MIKHGEFIPCMNGKKSIHTQKCHLLIAILNDTFGFLCK